jgi:hypothetical protein
MLLAVSPAPCEMTLPDAAAENLKDRELLLARSRRRFHCFLHAVSFASASSVRGQRRRPRSWGTTRSTTERTEAGKLWVCTGVISLAKILFTHPSRIRGAMVARLTPDQKVACSIHVGFKIPESSPVSFLIFSPLT